MVDLSMNRSMLGLMTSWVSHRRVRHDGIIRRRRRTMRRRPGSTAVRAGVARRDVGRPIHRVRLEHPHLRVPPEHAVSLTRASGPGNMANMAQFTSLMGGVEDDIVECFRDGGGFVLAVPEVPGADGRDEARGSTTSLSSTVSSRWSTDSSTGCARASTSATSAVDRDTPST